MFSTGDLTEKMCVAIQKGYRAQYSQIQLMWAACDVGFRGAMNGEAMYVGPVVFEPHQGGVWLQLPSGRCLRYRNPRLEARLELITYLDDEGNEAGFMPEEPQIVCDKSHVYGGRLTDNLVRAIARDVLAEAILKLERGHWPVYLHVHDEVVLHVPVDRAEVCKQAAIAALSTPPAWATGLVLNADGEILDDLCKG
jgi:DNA polymerase